VFQEIESPALVPEAIDEEATLAVAEVSATETIEVERVTVSEHYLAVEYIQVRPPERPARPRGKSPETAA
jgi:hypothetical protein